MNFRFLTHIDDIEPNRWDQLLGDRDYPFLQHRFLAVLERSGSVGGDSGWQPYHLVVEEHGQLVAALPLYRKDHSWGEYVFDWSWADAYQRLGINYYPKLLTAVPFTPATGPRLLIDPASDRKHITHLLIEHIQQLAQQEGLSGWHLLFPNSTDNTLLRSHLRNYNLHRRTGTQFHWHNRNYQSFEDFLEALNSRKRKSIRNERRRIDEQQLQVEIIEGPDIPAELWQQFYILYHRTYLKRSGNTGYLSQAFFEMLGTEMADQVVMATACHQSNPDKVIACSLFFRDSDTLYGRYWGALREYDTLHFELCYYQGIEYAIKKGLNRFDAGAQGEHKIKRGFEPVETCSYHWLADERFNKAIENFLLEEGRHNKLYLKAATAHLPFKED